MSGGGAGSTTVPQLFWQVLRPAVAAAIPAAFAAFFAESFRLTIDSFARARAVAGATRSTPRVRPSCRAGLFLLPRAPRRPPRQPRAHGPFSRGFGSRARGGGPYTHRRTRGPRVRRVVPGRP